MNIIVGPKVSILDKIVFRGLFEIFLQFLTFQLVIRLLIDNTFLKALPQQTDNFSIYKLVTIELLLGLFEIFLQFLTFQLVIRLLIDNTFLKALPQQTDNFSIYK